MIKFDKSTCMVIASTDEIKYETRVSNIIAFGSPWPIPSIYNVTSISFHNKKASSNFLTDRSKTVLLLWIFLVICVCLCHNAMSVSCRLEVICGERADLLALLYVMFSCFFFFVTFPCGVPGAVVDCIDS